jgi:hypothetical protein
MPREYAMRPAEFYRAWLAREGHPYRPDLRQPLDPIVQEWPCRRCGRFPASFLHPGIPKSVARLEQEVSDAG